MPESPAEKLLHLATLCQWLGKYDEARILDDLAAWCRANELADRKELRELLEMSNDNPNIKPLPEILID